MSDDVRRVSLVYGFSECGWDSDGPVTANKMFPHHEGGFAIMPWDEYERLRARIEELEKDSLRLNWLEQKCSGASDSERYTPFRLYWGGGSHGDIRRAIDEFVMETTDE